MIKKTEKIWLDGKFTNWDDAKVHILTHTLHYGLGAFEGIRCYECDGGRSAIFRLKEHVDRLFNSAKIATIKIPYKDEEIFNACLEVMRVNKLKHGYIRPIVFIGDGEMGLYAMNNSIRVAVIAWPWGTYLGEEGVKKGIRARISSFIRHTTSVSLSKAKINGLYVNSILAKGEALTTGFEEAIMLDDKGYVSEATGENIFIAKGKKVKTPPLSSSILGGITRDSTIQILKDKNITVEESPFSRDELYGADEVFLTGTAAEITPIREIDKKVIGNGKPGPITKGAQETFFAAAHGKDKKYTSWLTYI